MVDLVGTWAWVSAGSPDHYLHRVSSYSGDLAKNSKSMRFSISISMIPYNACIGLDREAKNSSIEIVHTLCMQCIPIIVVTWWMCWVCIHSQNLDPQQDYTPIISDSVPLTQRFHIICHDPAIHLLRADPERGDREYLNVYISSSLSCNFVKFKVIHTSKFCPRAGNLSPHRKSLYPSFVHLQVNLATIYIYKRTTNSM